MIRQYELLEKIQSYNKDADVAFLNRAYVFSMKAHGNQRRASGEPYLIHPLEVASLLADLKLDDVSIAVGLLHDTLEDTLASYDELKDLFGVEVADLTDGVTKLSRIEFDDKKVEQAENYRKLFLAMSKDIRVLLIKLCDRLHNMRTVFHIPKEEKRRRIAQETMDIYCPLADRIGLYAIKTELEELSFRELDPEAAEGIESRKTQLLTSGQGNLVDKVVVHLKEALAEEGVIAEVKGREKTVYSIHRKMLQKSLTFDQLTDIVAYRIVVEDQVECYKTLGHIHNIFKAIPGRFKDYISAPKENGYQSLHTSVIGPFGNRMEIQIRDKEMDAIADSGVAAHWLYKQATGKSEHLEGKQYRWLREMIESLQDTEGADEFIENAKLDLFSENVFVFSPKGDLVSLPAGATPLDFAYHVHSEVGDRCQTAKVNDRVVPLRTRLQNGDQIEIITSKNQNPTAGWKDFVVSSKAKNAINRFLRVQELDEQITLGKEILDKAFRKEGLPYNEKDLSKVFAEHKLDDTKDLYAAISQGRVFPRQIFNTLFPDRKNEQKISEEDKAVPLTSKTKFKERRDTRVGIDGLTPGMAIYIAKCCNPLPGENIVGIINTGRGITIHRIGCNNLKPLKSEPDRWLNVKWNDNETDPDKKFVARMRVALINDKGVLSTFSTAVYNEEGSIFDFFIEKRTTDIYIVRCDIEVKNKAHFDRLVKLLNGLSCVQEIERLAG